MADKPKVTSTEIKAALRSAFAAPAYQTFFEVGNDTGAKVRRHADAVSVGIWPSTGHVIHGFEIKVSRSDFLAEMKDPAKSLPIFKHCHRWSLVTPAGLVKPNELPQTWGLMVLNGGGLRTVVPPEKLDPEPLTPGFMAALVRRAGEMDGAIIAEHVRKARQELEASFQERIEREVAYGRRELSTKAEDALKVVDGLKAELGEDIAGWNVAEVAAAIKAVRKAGLTSTWQGMGALITALAEAQDRIRSACEEAGFEILTPTPRKRA